MPTKKTKKDYHPYWRVIAKQVKIDAGYKCEKCHKQFNTRSGSQYGVHHIDGNLKNNERTNLKALCCRCHLRAEADGAILNPHQLTLFA